MGTPILRAVAPLIVGLTLVFSVFVLLRGHNEPGGGFIGGLIAGAGFATLGVAFGAKAVREALPLSPPGIAGLGLLASIASGLPGLDGGRPFMTGLRAQLHLLGASVDISTVMLFDLGVFLIVAGTFAGVALALEEDET